MKPLRADAGIASVALHGKDLDVRGIRAAVLGGSFSGNVHLANLDRFRVEGDVTGMEVRRLVAQVGRSEPPWDGRLSGPVRVEGSLKRTRDVRVTAALRIAPAGAGAPVTGSVDVAYDGRTSTIGLGRSFLALPHSRADFSGTLGRELRVHLESSDLGDLDPLLEKPLPVKFANGSAIFDGTVTGALEDPRVEGQLQASHIVMEDRPVDSVSARVAATRSSVAVQNGAAARGTVRAQFSGSLQLADWKPQEGSAVSPPCLSRKRASRSF